LIPSPVSVLVEDLHVELPASKLAAIPFIGSPSRKTTRNIVNHISMQVKPGQLLSIMGGSGI
jgi:ABC-type transporter Mla maintaining outer membrane lipid asymmetry ATPase subunit MlaF